MTALIAPLFFLLGLFGAIVLVLFLLFSPKEKAHRYLARPVLTNYEGGMYLRLKQAFPECHVFAQVAFSALMTSEQLSTRSQFNRKVTDFVLLDDQFNVMAIIELDDPTHLDKAEEDAFRDYMFNEAGYLVYRYTDIPSARQLRRDILGRAA